MRAEGHALFCDFSQFAEAEHLKSTRVSQNRPRPRHEMVKAAQLTNLLPPRPEIQVIGVAQQDFHSKLFKYILRCRFHRALRTDGHEDGSFHLAVRREEVSFTGGCFPSNDFEMSTHSQAILTDTMSRWGASQSLVSSRREHD